ncbi:hypothetical protein FQZ97_865070 [compost metagenome]
MLQDRQFTGGKPAELVRGLGLRAIVAARKIAASAQYGGQRKAQLAGFFLFADKAGCPDGLAPWREVAGAQGAVDQHPEPVVMGLQALDQVQPPVLRNRQFHDDQVRPQFPGQSQGLRAGLGHAHHRMSQLLDMALQGPAQQRLVIDYQYSAHPTFPRA